jgi:hypothetical protein
MSSRIGIVDEAMRPVRAASALVRLLVGDLVLRSEIRPDGLAVGGYFNAPIGGKRCDEKQPES